MPRLKILRVYNEKENGRTAKCTLLKLIVKEVKRTDSSLCFVCVAQLITCMSGDAVKADSVNGFFARWCESQCKSVVLLSRERERGHGQLLSKEIWWHCIPFVSSHQLILVLTTDSFYRGNFPSLHSYNSNGDIRCWRTKKYFLRFFSQFWIPLLL